MIYLNYPAIIEIIFHMISFSDRRMSAELLLDFTTVADSAPSDCLVTGLSMFLFMRTVYLKTVGQESRFGEKDAGLLI